jgi:hypothetical protein
MPFICLKRTDIPNSILQITDLWPNKSQYNAVIDPPAVGPRYIDAPVTSTISLATPSGVLKTFASAQSGLAAYLLANVQQGGAGGPALTPANGNLAAAALITRMRAGSTLALADINAVLAAVVAGTELTTAGGSLSTGTVMDILRVLSGVTYTVPAGHQIQAAGPIFLPPVSPVAFNAANFAAIPDILPTDSAFYLSLTQGKLAGFKSASFVYLGVTGAGITVYDNTGGVY